MGTHVSTGPCSHVTVSFIETLIKVCLFVVYTVIALTSSLLTRYVNTVISFFLWVYDVLLC